MRKLVRVVQLPDRFISGNPEPSSGASAASGRSHPERRSWLVTSAYRQPAYPAIRTRQRSPSSPVLALLGPERFAAVGTPEEAPGTVLLTSAARLRIPPWSRCPPAFRWVPSWQSRQAPAGDGVLVGGYHGMWLPAETAYMVPVSREGLAAVGGTLDPGIVLPLGDGTCPLGEVSRVANYLACESLANAVHARSACPPSRGTWWRSSTDRAASKPSTVARRSGAGVAGTWCGALCIRNHDQVRARIRTTIHVCAHASILRAVRPVLWDPALADRSRAGRTAASGGGGWTRGTGHGLCAHLVPEVIHLDAQGYPVLLEHPRSRPAE